MFHLKNKVGNVHKTVKSERKRDELLQQGYVEEEPDIVGATPYLPKAKRSGKNGQSRTPAPTVKAEKEAKV